MEGVPDRGSRCWSRGSGRYGLGGFRPGGPTRRRERQVRRKPERKRRQERQRSATWAAPADKTPGTAARLESRGECGTPKRRTRVCVRTPSPGNDGGSQSPSSRARRKFRGQRREPTSTGNRSREFGKQTSDERIVKFGACPAGRRKAQRRERYLARRRPVPGWEAS
jgi:hypothetical protein